MKKKEMCLSRPMGGTDDSLIELLGPATALLESQSNNNFLPRDRV